MPTQKKIFPRALDPPLRPTLTESFEIRRHTEDGRAFLTSGKDKKKLLRRHTVQSPLENMQAGDPQNYWKRCHDHRQAMSSCHDQQALQTLSRIYWKQPEEKKTRKRTFSTYILYTHMPEIRNWDLKKDYVRIDTTSP
jgi:hypothetical protein